MTWALRPLALGDAALICDHRARIFVEDGCPHTLVASAGPAFQAWLVSRMRGGDYLGWAAEESGAAIGSVGLRFLDWPPHPDQPDCDRRGYVLNLFVEPAHRGRGVGRALMGRCDEEARARGVQRLWRNASKHGRRLYDALGWSTTNAMARLLEGIA